MGYDIRYIGYDIRIHVSCISMDGERRGMRDAQPELEPKPMPETSFSVYF